jgi:hypothetical protein
VLMVESYPDHHRLSLRIYTILITLDATSAWCAARTLQTLS